MNNFGQWGFSAASVAFTQPSHGEQQVRDLSEIVPGKRFKRRGVSQQVIEIMSHPYEVKDGGWWVQVSVNGEEGEISLGDCGVVAYVGGSWNETNWLERLPN
jgi:hypothetical protein